MNKKTFNFAPAINSRLVHLCAEQTSYQQNYLTLAGFLIGLKNAEVSFSYIPADYRQQAQGYYDSILKIVQNYADTLGYELENMPSEMIDDLDKLDKNLAEAIPAALRLADNSSNDKRADKEAVNDAIDQAIHFVNKATEDLGIIIANLNSFYQGKKPEGEDGALLDLENDMNAFIEQLDASLDYDHDARERIEKIIQELQRKIANSNKTLAGLGLTSGVSIFLAAGSVVLAAATGSAAPLVLAGALAFVAAVAAGGVIGFSVFISELQEELNEYAKNLKDIDYSLVQLDLMRSVYSGFVGQVSDVINSVEAIKAEWLGLGKDLIAMRSAVNEASDDVDCKLWGEVADDLATISDTANKARQHIEKLDVSKVKVTDGNYNYTMSQSDLQTVFDNSKKLKLSTYLMIA